MHQVKLPAQDAKSNDVINNISNQGYAFAEAKEKLIKSADTALSIVIVTFDFMEVISKLPKRNWVVAWNQNTILVQYFGEITHPRQFRKAMRRLDIVKQRLIEGVTIELTPSSSLNSWRFRMDKIVKLFSNLLRENEEKIGALIVADLMRLKFSDKKVGKLAYGEQLAINLAISEPLKARRNLRIINTI